MRNEVKVSLVFSHKLVSALELIKTFTTDLQWLFLVSQMIIYVWIYVWIPVSLPFPIDVYFYLQAYYIVLDL